MTASEFGLQQAQAKLVNYIKHQWPKRAGEISMRFINGNFRAQGWQGSSFTRWKPNRRKGTILVKKGRLRRSTAFTAGIAAVRVYNSAPYAAAHNSGFQGTVRVAQHSRRRFTKQKVEAGGLTKTGRPKMKTVSVQSGKSIVKAHTRQMNLPRRQFMPTSPADSPILRQAIIREVERTLKSIFPGAK